MLELTTRFKIRKQLILFLFRFTSNVLEKHLGDTFMNSHKLSSEINFVYKIIKNKKPSILYRKRVLEPVKLRIVGMAGFELNFYDNRKTPFGAFYESFLLIWTVIDIKEPQIVTKVVRDKMSYFVFV